MDYISITDAQRERMLAAIGARSVEELLADVPAEVRLRNPLNLPPALDEQSLRRELLALAEGNCGSSSVACFAGAGAYDHFVPAVVDALSGKGEFLTAYTPYQAEASQGSLQAFFEFQTLLCQLTGMDVANASMYEAATALAEALLMLCDESGKREILLCEPLHPHYRRTVQTYLADLPLSVKVLGHKDGGVDFDALQAALTRDTAAVAVQSPNFFGVCESRLPAICTAVHEVGGGVVQVFDPISLGIFRRPAELGTDVAVGEGQPLGTPLSFGGPYLGLFACREKYLRKMPGRLIGQTVDADGRTAYCLTLQTREQHIRRAKATSNICTNEGLLALRASIYLATLGPHGLANAATLSMQRAHELCLRVGELKGYELPFANRPFFREFVLRSRKAPVEKIIARGLEKGILVGVALGQFDPQMSDCLLVACTEKRTLAELDTFVQVLTEVGQ